MTETRQITAFDDIPENVSVDVLNDALSDYRRRVALVTVARRGEPVDIDELAREIAAADADDPEPGVARCIEISLYHVHAPKLDDAGLVDFDPVRETIAPGEETDVALTVLDELSTSA